MGLVQPGYRGDIDGLRALAVLSVIAFHAFPRQCAGGFVGVDVFFVISGFLISTIIYQSLQRGSFSFIEFYARRARRIFPALIAVLVACAIAGWFLMLQSELQAFGKNIAAAAAFVANFAYYQQSGYFDETAALKPLLHLWSLGVEEQFYLVWPLLVVVSSRWRNGPLAIAAIVFAASFASNILLIRSDAAAAFYLPVPRFWELMLGSGLAMLALRKSDGWSPVTEAANIGAAPATRAPIAAHAMAWTGALLLVAALLLIDPNRAFPGWWALLPTFGTALIIAAGPRAAINRLLSHRWLVYIGLISYPLYLWHWPILAFARLVRINEPTDLMRFGAVVAAFILADLTYRFIEKPIRSRPAAAAKTIGGAVALLAAGCVGVAFYVSDGFPQRLPDQVRKLGQELAIADDGLRQLTDNPCFRLADFAPTCDGGGDASQPLVMLWGDSHAAHLDHGLRALKQSRGDFRLAEYAAPACPPLVDFTQGRQLGCGAVSEMVVRKVHELNPQTVILASRWELYSGPAWGSITEGMISDTVKQLTAAGARRVVVIGQFPVWQAFVPRIKIWRLRMSIAGDESDETRLERAFPADLTREIQWDQTVQRALAGTEATFISPLSTFCNRDGCLLAVPGSEYATALDYDHLSAAASDFFVRSNAPALLGH